MTLYSIAEASKDIGVHKTTISRACARHGIGQRVGGMIALTSRDIARLKSLVRTEPGNPNFVAGNYFGGARERPKKNPK